MTSLQSSTAPCTYLGADSGQASLQISLYYDLVAAACTGLDREQFLRGSHAAGLQRGRSAHPAIQVGNST